MTGEFRLDPAGMREMLNKLGAKGGDLSAALTQLNIALDRYDGCWGEDKAGKKFAEGYVDNGNGTRDALKEVPTSVSDATEGIKSAIAQFQGLDEDNAKLFDQQLADSMQQQEGDGQGN
ncbi:hypothetical protein QRX60_29545 [Amycolatopsis mongoliensis]|uniref:WXG100 family type VII secretion target n=1 Tax=Amycolatopsis mongoliensis TaxID=715475 RepID=A0A9Y2JGI7_9PSEU|nr:hypothetical protein [Amycolatopsis sp. 4-36]WIX98210.1 hypothetical protein QRX60_29545 [Amycolatopsis sp. 4-36]